jgi:predicted type IV restriction endonuclease
MALTEILTDIITRLRQGRFANEQAISQGIVLRLLQELGWDTWDTALVWPEYQTGEGRADFALCHPPSRPAVFIEVKQPGKAEDAVRQALEYAFHTGVPFVVLTDGKTWSFYLPAEQGSYDERRVYKLDLFERAIDESAAALRRYLSREQVTSGSALETAREEYRSRNRRSQARNAIPEAWQELASKGDETLVELVASAAESKAGIRPDEDDVANFLASLAKAAPPPADAPGASHPSNRSSRVTPPPTTAQAATPGQQDDQPATRRGHLLLLGRKYEYANAKDAMLIILRELAARDDTFLERCAKHPDAQGRTRRYIARTPEELYPNRPDLREFRESLPGGWFIGTNLNNIRNKNIIKLAADVAGLRYGQDVQVEF